MAGYPRLADVTDIPRLVSSENVIRTWPPPGTTVQRLAFPELWQIVWGETTAGDADTWFVTDLATVTGLGPTELIGWLAARGQVFGGPMAIFAGAAGNWPVIYQENQEQIMRYIKVTHRGTLGSVEQFQWQMCLGHEGNDPDISEADALALATDLADKWAGTFNFGTSNAQLKNHHSNAVKYTEIGVTTETITSGTSSDGTGGNLEQAYPTQWSMYPIGSEPVGVASMSLPYEVAMCLTTQSDYRGPSGRGRFYWPPFNVGAMAADGLYADIALDASRDAISRYFDEIRADHDFYPVVVSKRRVVLHEVKQVLIGYVPDSQRRRRRNQEEARFEAWSSA